jgi:hypothetical protein
MRHAPSLIAVVALTFLFVADRSNAQKESAAYQLTTVVMGDVPAIGLEDVRSLALPQGATADFVYFFAKRKEGSNLTEGLWMAHQGKAVRVVDAEGRPFDASTVKRSGTSMFAFRAEGSKSHTLYRLLENRAIAVVKADGKPLLSNGLLRSFEIAGSGPELVFVGSKNGAFLIEGETATPIAIPDKELTAARYPWAIPCPGGFLVSARRAIELVGPGSPLWFLDMKGNLRRVKFADGKTEVNSFGYFMYATTGSAYVALVDEEGDAALHKFEAGVLQPVLLPGDEPVEYLALLSCQGCRDNLYFPHCAEDDEHVRVWCLRDKAKPEVVKTESGRDLEGDAIAVSGQLDCVVASIGEGGTQEHWVISGCMARPIKKADGTLLRGHARVYANGRAVAVITETAKQEALFVAGPGLLLKPAQDAVGASIAGERKDFDRGVECSATANGLLCRRRSGPSSYSLYWWAP